MTRASSSSEPSESEGVLAGDSGGLPLVSPPHPAKVENEEITGSQAFLARLCTLSLVLKNSFEP